MIMNKNRYKHISPFFALICLLALSSCLDDNIEAQPEGKGEIIVSFRQNLTLNQALEADDDLAVNTLRVFVFAGNILEAVATKDDLTEESGLKFFCIPVTTGLKDIYMVANETGKMTAYFDEKEQRLTKPELLGIIADISDVDVAHLPMTGSALNRLVEETNVNGSLHTNHKHVKIELAHISARIDLMFDKFTDLKVVIKEIHLLENIQKSRLFPNSNTIDGQTTYDISFLPDFTLPLQENEDYKAAALDLTDRNNGVLLISPKYKLDPIYVFEKSSATQLKVIVEAGGSTMEYYANIGTDGIKRGERYILYGRIFGEELSSITMKVKVLTWEQRENHPIPLE
jgi:hypothetical protein